MIVGILMALFVAVQPLTVSTNHLMCNQGKCPKVNCFVGWQYRGYDMNGRLFTTCRSYTYTGQMAADAHEMLMNHVDRYLLDKK